MAGKACALWPISSITASVLGLLTHTSFKDLQKLPSIPGTHLSFSPLCPLKQLEKGRVGAGEMAQ